MAKRLTYEQVQDRKAKAAAFSENVLGESDKGADFDDMSVEEYADQKDIEIVDGNPRRRLMANGNGPTKADLPDEIDQLQLESDDLQDQLLNFA